MPKLKAGEPSIVGTNSAALQVFRVLSLFADKADGYGVTELAEKLAVNKTLAFRMLATLSAQGLLTRDESGVRYILSYSILSLRPASLLEDDIQALCKSYMQKLQALTSEGVFFSIPIGHSTLTIDTVPSQRARASRMNWGVPVPLHASPASRAVLASLTDPEIETYIASASPLKRFTKNTITTTRKLWEEVRTVRARGYALGFQDHLVGSTYVSFPVFGIDERPHGAITIGGPLENFTPDHIEKFLPEIKDIIAELHGRSRLMIASPILVSQ